MNIHEEVELQNCPYCGGAGLLEEEHGGGWYVMCLDCGSQTASIAFSAPEERLEAARTAARLFPPPTKERTSHGMAAVRGPCEGKKEISVNRMFAQR